MAAPPPALPLNHNARFASGGSRNRVLKNKYQPVSQGDYGLEAWRLER